MKKIILLLAIIPLCFWSCRKSTPAISSEPNTQEILDSLSAEKVQLKTLTLSTEAEKKIASFEDFQNLRNLITTLQEANPFHIRKYSDSTDLLIQSFKENLDEGGGDINVNSIKSRIVVLSTESGLLMELASKKNPASEDLLNANTRLLTAYNSLVIQLNELTLAIPENIEKELLRDMELFRDSIKDPEGEPLK